jgi:hypothetical protein
MLRVYRLFVCLLLCVFAGRAEAATVTLGWDPNSEADVARYYVGYRTSISGSEALSPAVFPSACSGSPVACMWSLTTAVAGQTYYFRVYAENTAGLRSGPSNEVSTTIPSTPPPPSGGGLALERGLMSFGAVRTGSTLTQKSPAQTLMVTQTASGGPLNWTASTSNARLSVSPTSGSGTRPITLNLAANSLNPGTYDDTLSVRVGSTTLNVMVRTRVYLAGTTSIATGFFDTPTDGVTDVSGAIPVTGWALDDVAVQKVDILRDPVAGEAGLVYLGTASFIAGSRPDVEELYPEAPLNFRAGWGFMVLTNMLPDQATGAPVGGNGPFRLHAYAYDAEGNPTYLGSKAIGTNNAGATRPFGSIDTPAQGGTVSGSAYTVFGWALSPGATIPKNGSTITVFVDGVARGNVVYNNFRSDIAQLFPGYDNSNGAVGYYVLNTTQLANGTHTIAWTVQDDQGRTEGIGSRFFTVQNGSSALTSAAVQSSTVASAVHGESMGQRAETLATVPPEYSIVEVKKAVSADPFPELAFPEMTGEVLVQARETEPIEVRLANQFTYQGGSYEGYVVVNDEMRPLPIGSTLDAARGVFRWQPGPGFVGTYDFVFIRKLPEGWKTRIPVRLTIAPKHDGDNR